MAYGGCVCGGGGDEDGEDGGDEDGEDGEEGGGVSKVRGAVCEPEAEVMLVAGRGNNSMSTGS